MELKREIKFRPAYDKRSADPAKNYGIHSVEIIFMLKGEHGAVQFVIYTSWHLPHVQREIDDHLPHLQFPYVHHQPMAADLGYHSPVPRYEGQCIMTESCEHLGGKPCYYDGSGVAAQRVFDVLRAEGDEGVWREMEEFYKSTFEVCE